MTKIQPGDSMRRIVKTRFMGNILHKHGTSLVVQVLLDVRSNSILNIAEDAFTPCFAEMCWRDTCCDECLTKLP